MLLLTTTEGLKGFEIEVTEWNILERMCLFLEDLAQATEVSSFSNKVNISESGIIMYGLAIHFEKFLNDDILKNVSKSMISKLNEIMSYRNNSHLFGIMLDPRVNRIPYKTPEEKSKDQENLEKIYKKFYENSSLKNLIEAKDIESSNTNMSLIKKLFIRKAEPNMDYSQESEVKSFFKSRNSLFMEEEYIDEMSFHEYLLYKI